MTSAADRLRLVLAPALAGSGVDLEEVAVERAGRRHVVRVVVDRDGGVDLDTVAEVSRRISQVLDDPSAEAVVPGPFVLEVTSPGVDRPLTDVRHWRRAAGRLVAVDLADGSAVSGRIVAVDPEPQGGAVVRISTDGGDRDLRLAEVHRAVVQVEFGRAAGDERDSAEQEEG